MSLKRNENIKTNVNELEIDVDEKTFAKAVDLAYKKEIKKIRVPGFRKGKAPKKVVEKIYGNDIFYNEAIDLVYKKALEDAITESKLDVVSVENFKIVYASEEKGLCFTVNCVLKPEVEVKLYKGIEVKKLLKKVSKSDVDQRIKVLKERVARITKVSKKTAAKKGNLVSLNYMGFLDGISLKGATAENYKLKLGSNKFVKGFEEQIIGHKEGEEFEIEVTFPKDYYSENLREKKVLFKCKINSIEKIELPKEDDEFAKDVSEFDSLEKLRENIKKTMEEENNKAAERSVEQKLIATVVENVSGEIPHAMIENKFEELFRKFMDNVKRKGLTLDAYLEEVGINEYILENDLRIQAEFQVKMDLAIEKIIKLEKLKASKEEIEQELEKFASESKLKAKDLKAIFPAEIIEKDILNRKAIDLIKENAKIKEEILKV